MSLTLFNTLTKSNELFTPLEPGRVRMYHCGPTVYNFVHIGNLRSFLMADSIRRTFEYLGYDVLQVMNITDIGHLVSDGDSGDDKMTKTLKERGLGLTLENMLMIGQEYTKAFLEDLQMLNIKIPHHMPRASEHIAEDIAIIQKLEARGYIYTTRDGIYFDTSRVSDYGKLGGLSFDEVRSRLPENSEKRNPRDFAVWKFDTTKGWGSPWGKGFPGWHIECSGMSMKYLGETFDIHTGGHDLASVHHNNEIAQSESAHSKPFVTYWIHNEFVNVSGGKMSKSAGTGFTLRTVMEKSFNPLSYRYLALQSHHRSPLNFSWESLQSAQQGLVKLVTAFRDLGESTGSIDTDFKKKFVQKLEDDFGLPQALALTHEMLKSPHLSSANKKATLQDFDRVLGLDIEQQSKNLASLSEVFDIPDTARELMHLRTEARNQKDWRKSDELRDQIKALGFDIQDTDTGSTLIQNPSRF